MRGLRRTLAILFTATLAAATVACSRGDALPERPDVVVVVIDSLRRDHLGGFGYGRETSPSLDRLCDEGVLFGDVVSVASHTVPVVASLLTGLYPTETGVRYYAQNRSFDGHSSVAQRGPRVPARLDLLAETFAKAGYRTAAVVSNPWLTAEAGFDQGFERFVEIQCSGLLGNPLPPCDGADVLAAALPDLEADGAPLFLYLHFMDVHYPYAKAGITQERFVTTRGVDRYRNGPIKELDPLDRDFMIALYDEGIAKMDVVLGQLVTRLDARTRADETLLVVTSDHGEEFHEHGGLGHGRSLYQEVVDSFVLFRLGGVMTPRRVSARISLVDVAPTLLEIAGIENAAPGSGTSLLPWLRGDAPPATPDDRPLFMDLGQVSGVAQGSWKLIRIGDRSELYDLDDDAGEQHDLAGQATAAQQPLTRLLEARLAEAVSPDDGAPEIDAATRERLRAVGYAE